jgi:hypothetical protein
MELVPFRPNSAQGISTAELLPHLVMAVFGIALAALLIAQVIAS